MTPSHDAKIEPVSSSSQISTRCLKSKMFFDELQFLDYLSTDFLYLPRFILASHQMVRLVQTETARSSKEIQEKLVDTMEIAKETLSEAGASPRPFIVCPDHLVEHRESYFNMLSAARSLVPYMKDSDVKLRLRRLLLPLTSMSRFRVVLPSEPGRPKADNCTPLQTWRDGSSRDTHQLSPGPTALVKPSAPRRRTRRASASAVLKFASSPTSYSSCSSDSASGALTSESVSSARRVRTTPYTPYTTQPLVENEDSDTPSSDQKDVHSPESDPSMTNPPQRVPPQTEPEQKPSVPPIQYVSPQSPRPTLPPKAPQSPKTPSLLQQQQRDFGAGYPAYRKDTVDSSLMNWDWSASTRSSLSGIDCNIPVLEAIPAPLDAITIFSEEEYDEADENFRKGLGWRPLRWRTKTDGESSPKASLRWCKSWDDALQPVPNSKLVTTMLATFPGEPIQPTPLAESTCIIM